MCRGGDVEEITTTADIERVRRLAHEKGLKAPEPDNIAAADNASAENAANPVVDETTSPAAPNYCIQYVGPQLTRSTTVLHLGEGGVFAADPKKRIGSFGFPFPDDVIIRRGMWGYGHLEIPPSFQLGPRPAGPAFRPEPDVDVNESLMADLT